MHEAKLILFFYRVSSNQVNGNLNHVMIRSFLPSVGTHYSMMDVLPAFGRTTGRATTLVKMDGNCGRRFGANEANRSDKTGIALI
jgi:hypothetical protein